MIQWDGVEHRSGPPGRRFTDLMTCPLHGDHHESIQTLWKKQNGYASKEDVKGKLDKWVFTLFVSSISALVIIASTVFGYVAVEALKSSKHIAVLQVNQNRLMQHFAIPTIEDPETARKILEDGQNKTE